MSPAARLIQVQGFNARTFSGKSLSVEGKGHPALRPTYSPLRGSTFAKATVDKCACFAPRTQPKSLAAVHSRFFRQTLSELKGALTGGGGRGVLLRVIAVPVHAIDPGQDFGDGGIELGGHFAAHPAVFE